MSRPANQLPRIVPYCGVEVYAPWCWRCDSDERTKWTALPGPCEDSYSLGLCLKCEENFWPDEKEAWEAREPERLAARLRELRTGT